MAESTATPPATPKPDEAAEKARAAQVAEGLRMNEEAKARAKARAPELDATEKLLLVIDPLLQVLFYEDGCLDVPPRPAQILSKGSRSLTLLVYDTESQFGLYRRVDGVKYHADPTLRQYERETLGVFDLTPLGKRLLDLIT